MEYGAGSTDFRPARSTRTPGACSTRCRRSSGGSTPLVPIEGSPPSLLAPAVRLPLPPALPLSFEPCATERPPLVAPSRRPTRACHLSCGEKVESRRDAERADWSRRVSAPTARNLVEARASDEALPGQAGRVRAREVGEVHAVEDVTLTVRRGETLGIVGESGCGKSTTARLMLRLLDPTAGTIRFDGRTSSTLSQRALRPLRREMQMIFQDPYSSLNPRKTSGRSSATRSRSTAPTAARKTRVQRAARARRPEPRALQPLPARVLGRPAPAHRRRPRARALNPKLIVCDEPVSALDVSMQAQVLNLLRDLQRDFDLTYVFISHDLSVIRQIADRIAVMYLGRVVEIGDSESIYDSPSIRTRPRCCRRFRGAGDGARRHARARRRRSVTARAAAGLRVPPALPALPRGPLRRRGAAARELAADARGGLPLPARALADDATTRSVRPKAEYDDRPHLEGAAHQV